MRLPYQFNEKTDAPNYEYGASAKDVLYDLVRYKRNDYYSIFKEHRPIEEQIVALSKAIGGIAEVLISKGRMSPEEFLLAIEDETYEVRPTKR